jgi:hypothetical protein
MKPTVTSPASAENVLWQGEKNSNSPISSAKAGDLSLQNEWSWMEHAMGAWHG